jgi:hypothetical protein
MSERECRDISLRHTDGQRSMMTLLAHKPDLAAPSYAEYTIRELRNKSGYTYNNDPALMMIVKDEARQTVLSLPFFPGC